MRYAFVSDIHANLPAWKAVLLDIRSLGIDRILCLGDVIGYGPNPVETLRSAHASVHDFVLGNHDAALCGILDDDLFNDRAREALDWTRQQLNRQASRFFRTLPLSLTGPDFRCAHGDFADPARFDYVVEPDDAQRSFNSVSERLLLVGHTHQPCIFVIGDSGTVHRLPPQDFVVESDKRFLINVGSVGQSRDGDIRASYIVYDADDRSVIWRRIPFDLDAYATDLDAVGLRQTADWFLAGDPRRDQPPLRDMLGFRPPADQAAGARDALVVRDIQVWKHRAGAWRKRCLAISGITLAGALAAGGAFWRHAHPAIEHSGPPVTPITATGIAADTNLLPPLTPVHGPQRAPAGWTLRLGHRWRQAARFTPDPETGAATAVISSTTDRSPLSLSAAPVRVEAGQRFQLRAMIRKEADFSGSIAVVIAIDKNADHQHERIPRYRVQEPTLRRSGGWELAQSSFDIPAGGERLSYTIDGQFTGTIILRDPELVRR